MIEQNGDGLRVQSPMLIANANALLEAGRRFFNGAGSSKVVFDLGQVQDADSSALAVIFGWMRTARAVNVDVRIVNPPASLISLAALYGVSESLPLA
ncbi:STAS domain-containing protein [Propionivibrio soli]|uniref:STAS domain-containing protein n=1 Tax=Propionivibrio soli TaxID=2976531 RepID=UPI0021E8FAF5|nr:STAS domain-containing protein [Propionivibrio soli]